jgi:hypothetical protein
LPKILFGQRGRFAPAPVQKLVAARAAFTIVLVRGVHALYVYTLTFCCHIIDCVRLSQFDVSTHDCLAIDMAHVGEFELDAFCITRAIIWLPQVYANVVAQKQITRYYNNVYVVSQLC